MKQLENYVCTLEQSKKLKELEVEQDSLFYWIADGNLSAQLVRDPKFVEALELSCWAAFTSQELGKLIREFLPYFSHLNGGSFGEFLYIGNKDGSCNMVHSSIFPTENTNEAQARAEFLIYLLEQKP